MSLTARRPGSTEILGKSILTMMIVEFRMFARTVTTSWLTPVAPSHHEARKVQPSHYRGCRPSGTSEELRYPGAKLKKSVIVVLSMGLMSCEVEESVSDNSDKWAGTGEIAAIPTGDQQYTEDVTSITYDPTTDTLKVAGDPFDLAGTFRRVSDQDVRGFAAFENEGGARTYLALVRTDAEHGLAAGVVGTPFRLDNEFGGTMLARDRIPNMPQNVEVTHTGSYAGIRNVGSNDGADTSESYLHRVEGRVRLDLDFFGDNTRGVEGVITDRRSLDQTVEVGDETRAVTYDDVVLRFNSISDEGVFEDGAAAVRGAVVGEYDGIIAGDDAGASAGVLVMVDEGELERGGFIATAD